MPAPMLDDMELKAVQWIRQEIDQDFARAKDSWLGWMLYTRN